MNTGWKIFYPWFLTGSTAQSIPGSFAPTDISGLQLWLDGADAASMTLDGSSNIEQWNDKSGNTRHAVQGTALNRPSYTSGGQINGKNAPTFNGTSTSLATSSFTVNQPSTLFVVFRQATPTTNFRVMFDSNSISRQFAYINAGTLQVGATTARTVGTITTGTRYQLTAIYNDASSSTRLNGTPVAISTPGVSSHSGSALIGTFSGGNFYSGQIGEVIFYSKALSAGEITQVETYLTGKW